MASTRDLLAYIIYETTDRGFPPIKTALVKLLYLSDIEAMRQGLPRLSNVNWRYYKFGPFSAEIEHELQSLVGREVDELEGITARGRTYRKYKLGEDEQQMITLPPEQKGIINRVLDRWAGESLERLLNYAYFETEPMLNATWGEPLDFSTVQKRQQRMELGEIVALAGGREAISRLRQLRDTFWSERESQRAEVTHPRPEPRFDEVFIKGLAASAEQDKPNQ